MPRTRKPLASIMELAQAAGVSYGTVSRVLNGRGRVSESARNRVLEAARRHHFRPRMQARRTTLALIWNPYIGLAHGYHPLLLTALMRHLALQDAALELFSIQNLHTLGLRIVDGVIALPWDERSRAQVAGLTHEGPRVLVNDAGLPGWSSVASDHAQSGALAAGHLLGKGHRRIGYVVRNAGTWGNRERLGGFRRAMAQAGAPFDERLLIDLDVVPLREALAQFRGARVSAVFVADEGSGPAALHGLGALGLSIPRDLSLLAMESPGVSPVLLPSLSAVEQPIDRIAERAVSLIMEQLAMGGGAEASSLLLENRLLERESVDENKKDSGGEP